MSRSTLCVPIKYICFFCAAFYICRSTQPLSGSMLCTYIFSQLPSYTYCNLIHSSIANLFSLDMSMFISLHIKYTCKNIMEDTAVPTQCIHSELDVQEIDPPVITHHVI